MKVYNTYANIELIIGGCDNEALSYPIRPIQSNDDW